MISHGRTYIYAPDHPNATHHGYVARYRLVMEGHLERHLTAAEVVHHKGTLDQDVPEKLSVLPTQGEHARLHFAKTSVETVLKVRELAQTMESPRIAQLLGIPVRRVRAIRYFETWSHLKP